ncbi:hypothetical protein [Oryza sativa Japonica Group]|uniref:Uncharacterized protein n=1 Tax=Oryza sativa subsp. japonica TaxID=39947 RepID=Q94IZ5_ORYSJ|nr:hypothetical protein [Oryza sativa Japonica Group]
MSRPVAIHRWITTLLVGASSCIHRHDRQRRRAGAFGHLARGRTYRCRRCRGPSSTCSRYAAGSRVRRPGMQINLPAAGEGDGWVNDGSKHRIYRVSSSGSSYENRGWRVAHLNRYSEYNLEYNCWLHEGMTTKNEQGTSRVDSSPRIRAAAVTATCCCVPQLRPAGVTGACDSGIRLERQACAAWASGGLLRQRRSAECCISECRQQAKA